MDTRRTLPITKARKQFFDIAKQVQCRVIHYTVTKRGKPKAVMISFEQFEYLAEVLKIQPIQCIKG